jgi:hypothetical protein
MVCPDSIFLVRLAGTALREPYDDSDGDHGCDDKGHPDGK